MCCQKYCFCLNKYYYILIFKTLKLANYKPGSCFKMFPELDLWVFFCLNMKHVKWRYSWEGHILKRLWLLLRHLCVNHIYCWKMNCKKPPSMLLKHYSTHSINSVLVWAVMETDHQVSLLWEQWEFTEKYSDKKGEW